MTRPLILLTLCTALLAGCGWFGGRGQSDEALPPQGVNPLIPQERQGVFASPEEIDRSVVIASLTDLRIDPEPSGVIVYVIGLAERQGAYDARLVQVTQTLPPEDGVLAFELRVTYPQQPTPVGSDRTRTVTEAYSLTNQDLQGVRQIEVRAARNTLKSRRR